MPRKVLPYTFGNHMHWVDMQWLWGYRVLPDSIDDMLALCAAVGAKGNVNFDAVGYEKLAAEDPGALARLRAAIAAGTVEVVGGSYGQPYGLFVGGESNLRQRTFGARAIRRLLGVWPRTFWEEEFDFFPQLPQLLAGCGFTGASLFFQWTWHTPSVPLEPVPLVVWEGADGTRLPAIARTELCLHQWPEDFDGKLERAQALERPAIVQWLELMPSPDWMCRSEVLLPRLRGLFADARFDVVPCTLAELIARLDDGAAPVRRYTMDDVFHGMTIGKNGDRVPRLGDRAEQRILAAEALLATLGLCGRPYASWDVYPAWELDEAWRELLQAQHHDNHECEALCGAVGRRSFERATALADDVLTRGRRLLAGPVATGEHVVVHNALGFARDVAFDLVDSDTDPSRRMLVRDVPAFGWRCVRRGDPALQPVPPARVERAATQVTLSAGALTATVDAGTGCLTAIATADSTADLAAGALTMLRGGVPFAFGEPTVEVRTGDAPAVVARLRNADGDVERSVRLRPELGGVELVTRVARLPRPDGGLGAALQLQVAGLPPGFGIRADTPFAADDVRADGEHRRKYPSGDWMTSPQWFETVRGAFTARTFVDLLAPDGAGAGVLCVHDGSQGWFRHPDGVRVVLDAYDPWDEGDHTPLAESRLLLVPHGPASDAWRFRTALAARADAIVDLAAAPPATHPRVFGGLVCCSPQVVATAFHRESRKSLEHVADAFGPGVRNPFVVRLVECDGGPADVELLVPGPCAAAARTDHLGGVREPLRATPAEPPAFSPPDLSWSRVRLALRPREIATVMLDLELGRHLPRNLDDHRHVWATVHRAP
ncbi:MAG: hypothetical protein IPM29_00755 [Planctomycetes bacterium]|nr:hypothetical protein [Planctomycetota bacterium]